MISIVAFLILAIFRPFGLHAVSSVTFLAGFGASCFIILFVYFFILPILFPKTFESDRWIVGKETLSYIGNLLGISVLNYFYNSTVGIEISQQFNLLEFIFMTVAVGALPVLLMIYITEKIAKSRNDEKASIINQGLVSPNNATSSMRLRIVSQNKTEAPLDIEQNDFIMAKSSGNYIEIFMHYENNSSSKALLRLSLSELEAQLSDNSSFLRCHKSYLINKSNVKSVEGNARSCVAIMDNGLQIPISRTLDRSLLVN